VHSVFGAFMLGVGMPRGVLTRDLRRHTEPLTMAILVPLFFVYSGLNTRLALLDTSAIADTPKKAEWRAASISACERGEFDRVIDAMMPLLLHKDQQIGPLPLFVREMVGRVGAAAYLRRHRATGMRQDARDLLRAAKQPVRAICGRQDALNGVADHEEIAALAPCGRCSIIEDCGHMTIIERPQAATALLRDWLLYD